MTTQPSTTFIVAKLIEVANRAIDNEQALLDKYAARVEAYKKLHLQQWMTNTKPRLAAARTKITDALKTGQPVTVDRVGDLNKLLYSEPDDYVIRQAVRGPSEEVRRRTQNHISELKATVAALRAQTGETISINQLRLIGVPKINDLFLAAVPKEVDE